MRRRWDLAVFIVAALVITGCAQTDSSPTPAVTGASSTASTAAALASESSATAAANDVRGLAVGRDGALWAVTRGGVLRWDLATRTARVLLEGGGLPTRQASAVAAAPDGSIWVAGSGWVARYGGSWTVTTSTQVRGLAGDLGGLAVGRDGAVWVSVGSDVLLRFRDGAWTTITPPTTSGSSPWSGSLAVAPNGTVWIAPSGEQAVLAYDGSWHRYTSQDGLPGLVANVSVTPNGTVWVGGAGTSGGPSGDVPAAGIARFDGTRFTAVTSKDGLVSNDVTVIAGLDGRTVWAISSDSNQGGTGLARFDGTRWTRFADLGGSGWGAVTTPDGRLWMPSGHGVIGFDQTSTVHLLVPSSALPDAGPVPALTLTPAPGVATTKVATTLGTLEFSTWQFPVGRQLYRSATTDHGVVAVGGDSDALYWSSDLMTWHATPAVSEPFAVYRLGDQVVVTGQGGTALYAWNGSGWTQATRLDVSGVVERLAGGPRGSVAVVGSSYFRSGDGVHFTIAARPPSKDRLTAAGSGGCRGGFGSSGPADVTGPVQGTGTGFVSLTPAHPGDWKNTPVCEPVLWTSPDGSQWQPVALQSPFGTAAFVQAIAERDGRYVAVGGTGADQSAIWLSDDGVHWTRTTLPDTRSVPVPPGLTITAGRLGWIITGRASAPDADRLSDAFWVSTDGRTFAGPYPLPEALGSGYAPTVLAIGPDFVLGIGGRGFVPVIARRIS
jgi:hypothetical protein